MILRDNISSKKSDIHAENIRRGLISATGFKFQQGIFKELTKMFLIVQQYATHRVITQLHCIVTGNALYHMVFKKNFFFVKRQK